MPRSGVRTAAIAGVGLCIAAAGCSRSPSPTSAPSSAAASSTATAAPGDFGALAKICGPGTPQPSTARGLSGNAIRIGVLSDTGSTVVPGIEQEFFDTADAFSSWCNAAGGINGRKVVIDKLDAKLFNVGAVTLQACQKDFMLVGGGNALDEQGVKFRLGCKLGAIPAYNVSTEAANAGLQVRVVPASSTRIPIGAYRLLAEKYPDSKTKGIALGTGAIASLHEATQKNLYAVKQLGFKAIVQEKPVTVDNYRPYMESLKSSGIVGLYEVSGETVLQELEAMKTVDYQPQWVEYSYQFYNDSAVQAAKSLGTLPPVYVALNILPFDLSSTNPTLGKIKQVLTQTVSKPLYTQFTSESFSAWMLFAKAATACGPALTQDCVLQKAGSEKAWTAGGIQPPVSTDPTADVSDCVAIVRLTATGWVYDKDVTKPNQGIYNCNPDNVATVPANP